MSACGGAAVSEDALRPITDNPFYVLGLRPTCAAMEAEREGRKLLGMLELRLSEAARYTTPVGERARTIEKVREAMAELRDPDRRLVHELWAQLDPQSDREKCVRIEPAGETIGPSEGPAPWSEALQALGW